MWQGAFALGRSSSINMDELVAYVERTLSSLVEGQPVPSRTEMFIDYGNNVSYVILRLRLVRPDLYEEYCRLEAAAIAEAQRRVDAVVHEHAGSERRVLHKFKAIQLEFGLGDYTLSRMREQARGGKYARASWDWKRVHAELKRLIKAKDTEVLTIGLAAARFGPEYHVQNARKAPTHTMSENTLTAHLRTRPAMHQALLKLCALNRNRRTKEVT